MVLRLTRQHILMNFLRVIEIDIFFVLVCKKIKMPSATTVPETVIVHPLVLLSVVDHYLRVAENTKKRVVGVLLGQNNGKTVNVSNAYARTLFQYLIFTCSSL